MKSRLLLSAALFTAGFFISSCLSTDPFTTGTNPQNPVAGTSAKTAQTAQTKPQAASETQAPTKPLPPAVPAWQVTTDLSHSSGINDVAFSPDGGLLATAGREGVIKLWRTQDRSFLKNLKGHGSMVTCLAFSPDGKTLASGSFDGTVRVWRLDDGSCLQVLQPMLYGKNVTGMITSVDVSPDGKFVAASHGEPQFDVWVWDLATGKVAYRIMTGDTKQVRFSRDGKHLLAAIWYYFWDEKTKGKVPRETKRPDGTRIIDFILAYDITKTKVELVSEIGALGDCCDLRFSPDGKTLAYLGNKGFIELWETDAKGLPKSAVPSARIDQTAEFHSDRLYDNRAGNKLGFSLDSKKIFCTARSFAVWEIASGRKLYEKFYRDSARKQSVHVFPLGGCALSPDGKTAAVVDLSAVYFVDFATGADLAAIEATPVANDLKWSRDGKTLAAATNEGKLWLWDGASGNLLRRIDASKWAIKEIDFNAEGTKIASLAADGVVKIWDVKTGRLLSVFGKEREGEGLKRPPEAACVSVLFAPDGKLLAGHASEGYVSVIDPDTGKAERTILVHKRKGWVSPIRLTSASKDGLVASVAVDVDNFVLWKYPTGEILWKLTFGREASTNNWTFYDDFAVTPDGNTITYRVLDSANGHYVILKYKDPASGKFSDASPYRRIDTFLPWTNDRKQQEALTKFVSAALPSPDGKKILLGRHAVNTSTEGAQVSLFALDYHPGTKDKNGWDTGTEFKGKFLGHKGGIIALAASPDFSRLASSSADGTVRIWNAETGGSFALVMKGTEWIAYDDRGYFDASRNGGGLIGMSYGPTTYRIDQFAAKYNRPDLILAEAGLGSKDQLDHYKRQYEKRLAKLGLTEESLKAEPRVPVAKFATVAKQGREVSLRLAFEEAAYALKSYNVYVNDVPLFGASGKPLAGKKAEAEEKLLLDPGRNKIEISCLNDRGVESYREFLSEEYKEPLKGDLYYLGFGVSDYQDPAIQDLTYAHKDILDLETLFKGMKGSFKTVRTKALVNAEVTPKNLAAAKGFLAQARPEDTVVLAISGHGVHDKDTKATYYFLTSDAKLADLSRTAADFELIEDLLMGIAPRNKLFLMDTCESGEPDEDSLKASVAFAAKSRGVSAKTSRGIQVTGTAPSTGRNYLNDRDRYIYNDLARRSGAIVFSSCRGGEVSFEDGTLQNGFFTKEILAALGGPAADANKDGVVDTDELRAYVSRTVAQKTDGAQNPTVDRDNLYQKVAFPVR